MKFRFFIVFTLALAMITLGTSCSRPSKNFIIGKWKLTSCLYRDDPTSEWEDGLDGLDGDEFYEFRDDNTGTCYSYYDDGDEDEDVFSWSYDKDNNTITFDSGETYTIQDYSSNEMTLHYREPDRLFEQLITLKKIR